MELFREPRGVEENVWEAGDTFLLFSGNFFVIGLLWGRACPV